MNEALKQFEFIINDHILNVHFWCKTCEKYVGTFKVDPFIVTVDFKSRLASVKLKLLCNCCKKWSVFNN